jgi:hypothetical protein
VPGSGLRAVNQPLAAGRTLHRGSITDPRPVPFPRFPQTRAVIVRTGRHPFLGRPAEIWNVHDDAALTMLAQVARSSVPLITDYKQTDQSVCLRADQFPSPTSHRTNSSGWSQFGGRLSGRF